MNNADALITTCYGPVSQGFIDRAAKIRLLILDVDGVLSDGLIYIRCCSRARITSLVSTAVAERYAKCAICYYWRRASWMRPKGNLYE